MADLKINLCGIELDSPFVLGSGPAGFDAKSLAACAASGCGAVVTKSIAIEGFVNTTRHMISNGTASLINNEGGSDMPLKRWVDVEIPEAKALGVKTLIASVCGYGGIEETLEIAGACAQAGADMLEVVNSYSEPGEMVEMIRAVKKAVSIPVIAKVNGNWRNTNEVAGACDDAGADAITAIDSVGPGYRIDITTGRPYLGGNGYGYITGAPILPLSLRYVHDIAKISKKPIIGLGGVTSAKAAMEMLMAGASAVGVCSLPIIQGADVFKKLTDDLNRLMDQYGYKNIGEVSGLTLKKGSLPEKTAEDFVFVEKKCTHCGRCIKACAYRARSFDGDKNVVDSHVCRVCGLCFSVCPTKAISIV